MTNIEYWITSSKDDLDTANITARYDDYKFKFYKKATREYAQKWLTI